MTSPPFTPLVRTTATRPGRALEVLAVRALRHTRHEVLLPHCLVPPPGRSLRIVHLTDLHAHRQWMPAWEALLGELDADEPDLILFTGDFVEDKHDHRPAIPLVRRFIDRLHARLGVFGILGNHDTDLLPLNVPRWTTLQLLVGEQVRIDDPLPRANAPKCHPDAPQGHAGDRQDPDNVSLVRVDGAPPAIDLIGLPGVHREDVHPELLASFPPRRPGDLRIVMTHYPDTAPAIAAALAPDLVFAGHTHGGQICLPGGRPIITHDRLPHAMSRGLHHVGDSLLIVNRGLGFSGYPLRTFCPAEVTEVIVFSPPEPPQSA